MVTIKGFAKRVLLLGILLTMSSCSDKVDWFDKSFFGGENNINAEDFFNCEGSEYYIYYYSLYCNLCTQMRSDIVSFMENCGEITYTLSAQNLSEDDFDKFKQISNKNFNKDDIKQMNNEMIGKDNINEIYLIGTPMLFIITEHRVSEVYSGAAAVHEYISKYL